MIHYDITLEDTRLIATRTGEPTHKPWRVRLIDSLTDTQYNKYMGDEEFAAVVSLSVGEDCWSEQTRSDLYQIAEKALQDCPTKCRPIP